MKLTTFNRVVFSGVLLGSGFAAGTLTTQPTQPTSKASYPPIEVLLSRSQTVIDQPLVYPQGKATVTAAIVNMMPGKQTGWHRHDVPVYAYVLQGEVTVDYGEQGKKVYRKGDSLMEAIGSDHNGQNTGSIVTRILVVFAGTEDSANTTARAD